MIFLINQNLFIKALEQGGFAALSDDAQSDKSNMAPILKSVRISIDEDLVIESFTSLISSKWSMKATEDNGIYLKEKGSVIIPANELYAWVSKQSKCKILLKFVESKNPEVISGNNSDYNLDNGTLIKKIGSVKVMSKDDTKTGSQWSLDCYEYDEFISVNYDKNKQHVFTTEVEKFTEALSKVASSCLLEDYNHVFDSVSIEKHESDIYIGGSDKHRFSLYKLQSVSNINDSFFESVTRNVLINTILLRKIMKLSSGLNIEFSYLDNKIVIVQDNWKLRVSVVNINVFNSFPSLKMIFSKTYKKIGLVSKSILSNRLSTVSLVNKSSVLFDFKKDSLTIHAISETGSSPNQADAPVKDIENEVKIVLAVRHLSDLLKIIKDEYIQFYISNDGRSVKFISSEDENISYYAMKVDNPKYNTLLGK